MAWRSRFDRDGNEYGGYPPYVSAAERRKQTEREIESLRQQGRTITPIVIEGKNIATTFWGRAWCDNLEAYSDYENRLPRGRTYVRSGAIMHLEITDGRVEALVRGSSTYTVKLTIEKLARRRWSKVVEECSGQIGTLVELLGGKLSRGVMTIVTDQERGLFPSPADIILWCSCPDVATMCKHVAAVMYGVGARLDKEPELLFRLRGVDASELVTKSMARAATKISASRANVLPAGVLSDIFGIDIDHGAPPPLEDEPARPRPRSKKKR